MPPLLTDTFDAFGLDIGDRSLKAAYLRRSGKGIRLTSAGSVAVAKGVFEKGALVKPDLFCEHIQRLLAACGPKKITTRYVHACLPETQTFLKLLSFENVPPEELPARIREALPRHIPLSIDETYLDWTVMGAVGEGGVRVLVGAIPKKTSDSYTDALRRCSLVPVSLQIEAQAMLRALLPDEVALDACPLAVVDLGATRSSFVLFDRGSIQFTVTIPIAGEDATAQLASALSLPLEEAENAKHTMGLDPQKGGGSVRNILLPQVGKLCEAIQTNAKFYEEHFKETRSLQTVLLTGGGSLLLGLAQELQLALPGARIAHGNATTRLYRGEELGLHPSYATAIGLALTNVL